MHTIEELQNMINAVEFEIDDIQNQINDKQKEINNFEYQISENEFDEYLDEVEGRVTVAGMGFYPSDILKSCDPVAYRCAKNDYESNYDLDDVEEYNDLKDELELLEDRLSDLKSELDEYRDDLDSLENDE